MASEAKYEDGGTEPISPKIQRGPFGEAGKNDKSSF